MLFCYYIIFTIGVVTCVDHVSVVAGVVCDVVGVGVCSCVGIVDTQHVV